MAKTFRCDIVSAEATLFAGQAIFLVAPGQMGELGVMPDHAPLLTQLKPGKVVVTESNGTEQVFAISGGLLEVQPRAATILAETAMRAEDIDEAAANTARAEAKRALENAPSNLDLDVVRVELALSNAQLSALARLRRRGAP
jgi:F-type H+-transporting ATPase subunit epsilon